MALAPVGIQAGMSISIAKVVLVPEAIAPAGPQFNAKVVRTSLPPMNWK
jgi:hypothetical protein